MFPKVPAQRSSPVSKVGCEVSCDTQRESLHSSRFLERGFLYWFPSTHSWGGPGTGLLSDQKAEAVAEQQKEPMCPEGEGGGGVYRENWGVRPVGGVTASLAVCTVAGHWNPDKAVNEARRRKCCLGGRDAAGSLGGHVLHSNIFPERSLSSILTTRASSSGLDQTTPLATSPGCPGDSQHTQEGPCELGLNPEKPQESGGRRAPRSLPHLEP